MVPRQAVSAGSDRSRPNDHRGAFTRHALRLDSPLSNSPIVAAPDGNLWFQISNGSANAIARMTTAGTVTQFAANSFVAPVHSMTVGPDGAIWMTGIPPPVSDGSPHPNGYSFHSVGGFNPFGIVRPAPIEMSLPRFRLRRRQLHRATDIERLRSRRKPYRAPSTNPPSTRSPLGRWLALDSMIDPGQVRGASGESQLPAALVA